MHRLRATVERLIETWTVWPRIMWLTAPIMFMPWVIRVVPWLWPLQVAIPILVLALAAATSWRIRRELRAIQAMHALRGSGRSGNRIPP